MAEVLLGALADDYTGATDLAGMLAAAGVRTVQVLGLRPDAVVRAHAAGAQAVVIALKTRSVPADEARAASREALRQLRLLGARQIYFKYCSTFDSTAAGNIGPVADALLADLGTSFTVAVPALPVNGRTQYRGHLFVDGVLLSESPLAHHPLNPMTDPDLVRHLRAQTGRRVGLVAFEVVRRGTEAIREEMRRLGDAGVEIALVDALADEDLRAIARAVVDLPLVTGGSGLGMKLPAAWAERRLLAAGAAPAGPPRAPGRVLVLAGSCSARTLEQIARYEARGLPSIPLDVPALLAGDADREVARVGAAVDEALGRAPAALVRSSMAAADRARVLEAARAQGLSDDQARLAIERATAAIAHGAVGRGIDRLVVAGGETSGAVVEALDAAALEVGEMLAPGVPRCRALGGTAEVHLVLKSGNFGDPDFFLAAIDHLKGVAP